MDDKDVPEKQSSRRNPSWAYKLNPYTIVHGGAQGDSRGVGYHEAIGIQRTSFHLGVLQRSANPRDLWGGSPPICKLCFEAPFDNSQLVPEIVYSI